MPKFDKLKNKEFEETAKKSSETVLVVMVKKIKNENLFDYKENTEDITDTADLEESIKQLGFIDPIEVTDYGMAEGEFTIISGHRRRAAGVKQGVTVFPCLVRKFNNEAEIKNYVLLANSHRDSSKDPLLIAKRYRENKKYLKEQGQITNIREEVAKRLGLSTKQADRYNKLLDIIPEVWAMIQSGIVGMSSVLKMALYSEAQQQEILDILIDCNNEGVKLSREKCEMLISAYSRGMKSYNEIINSANLIKQETDDEFGDDDDKIVIDEFIDEQQDDAIISSELKSDEENEAGGKDGDINCEQFNETSVNTYLKGEADGADDKKQIPDKKTVISEVEQRKQRGANINKIIKTLKDSFNELYIFDDEKAAAAAVETMQDIMSIMLNELNAICSKYNNRELFDKGIEKFLADLKKYGIKIN